MKSYYKPNKNRTNLYQLEVYYFQLVMYTTSMQFKELQTEEMYEVKNQITQTSIMLQTLREEHSKKAVNDRKVVLWQDDSDLEYEFLNMRIASKCLNLDENGIRYVCKGINKKVGATPIAVKGGIKWIGGWNARYLEYEPQKQ